MEKCGEKREDRGSNGRLVWGVKKCGGRWGCGEVWREVREGGGGESKGRCGGVEFLY